MSDAQDAFERRTRKSSPIKPVLVAIFILVAAVGGYYIFRMEQATELAGAARDQIQEAVLQTPLGVALGDAGILPKATPKSESPAPRDPAGTAGTGVPTGLNSPASTPSVGTQQGQAALNSENTPSMGTVQNPLNENQVPGAQPNATFSGQLSVLPGATTNGVPSAESGVAMNPSTALPSATLNAPNSPNSQNSANSLTPPLGVNSGAHAPDATLPVVILPPLNTEHAKPGSTSTANTKNGGLVIQPRLGVAPMVLYTEPVPGAKSPQELAEEQSNGRIEKALIESSQNLTLSAVEQAEVPGLTSPLSDEVPTDSASVGRQDDAVVTPAFISDFAQLLVSSYKPATDSSNLSLKSVNLRYGTNLIGLKSLTSSSSRARHSVLAYVYSPPMLEALYGMYVDSFLLSMVEATEQPGKTALNSQQSSKMFAYYGREFSSVSGTLQAMSATPNLPLLGQNYLNAEDTVNKARARFVELGLAYDKARDAGRPQEALAKQMQEASTISRQASDRAETAKVELIGGIRAHAQGKNGLSDADTLYLTSWVLRRAQSPSESAFHESLASSAELFGDLSARCQEYSRLNLDN